MHKTLPLLLVILGCGSSDDETSPGDTATTPPAPTFAGAPLADLSSDDCPKLGSSGLKSFTSDGIEREVLVRFPGGKPAGMPVMFFWHGLGDSAEGIDAALNLQGFADDHKMVVVSPQSTDPFFLTWDVVSGGKDLVLFDDMRTCLANELDVDLARFSTAGFSYGALFTSRLVIERSDTLAAAMPMSGGTSPTLGVPYATPAHQVPVAVMWGGVADTFDQGFFTADFQAASESMVASLAADGHVVAACDHGLGHTLPGDYRDVLAPWVVDHVFGEPSPYADDLPGFPSYCTSATAR